MRKAATRVLIYRLGSMGDMIVSLPALHLIERAFPGADRRLLTNLPVNEKAAAAASIWTNSKLVDGYVHYPVATRNPLVLLKTWWEIVRWRPEVLVYLGSARGIETARRDRRFFSLCGISRQIGVPLTEAMQENRCDPVHGCEELECVRLVRNLAELGTIDVDSSEAWDMRLTEAEKARADQALSPAEGSTVLAVSLGTKVQVNHWGNEKWRELLRRVAALHPEFALVLTGVKSEQESSEYVADGWREGAGANAKVINLCAQLTPRESGAVFAKARLFLGHDSGPMHLADAVGTQVVAVFSARNPPCRWFPHGRQHHVVYHKVDCYGCGLWECVVERTKCMTSISVEEVFREVCAALENRRSGTQADWLTTYRVLPGAGLSGLEGGEVNRAC